MKNNIVINLNTYELLNEESGYIIVDSLIADTIVTLNKLGYVTLYSCSGHANVIGYDYYKQVCDIKLLDKKKIKENYKGSYIVDVNDKTFTLISPKQSTHIYIKFAKNYKFNSLPEGFKIQTNTDDDLIIEKRIEYYKDDILIDPNETQKELTKYNKILNEWAKSLPNIKERND